MASDLGKMEFTSVCLRLQRGWTNKGGSCQKQENLFLSSIHKICMTNIEGLDKRKSVLQGEPSVYMREAKSAAPSAGSGRRKRQVAGVDYGHSELCQVCLSGNLPSNGVAAQCSSAVPEGAPSFMDSLLLLWIRAKYFRTDWASISGDRMWLSDVNNSCPIAAQRHPCSFFEVGSSAPGLLGWRLAGAV